ncbi:MAG: FixH family protein [Pyrinomonadaceae bacterium]
MFKIVSFILIASFFIFALACGAGSGTGTPNAGKPIKSGQAGNLTVTISNSDGVLHKGKQESIVTFADAAGKPVDVGAASLTFSMPAMGSMSAMNSSAALSTTGTPGVYKASANIEMAGEWQAQITFDGPAGKGKASLPITAQ